MIWNTHYVLKHVHLGKTGWWFLKKVNMHLLYNPPFVALRSYPREIKTCPGKHFYTWMLTAALFFIVKKQKQPNVYQPVSGEAHCGAAAMQGMLLSNKREWATHVPSYPQISDIRFLIDAYVWIIWFSSYRVLSCWSWKLPKVHFLFRKCSHKYRHIPYVSTLTTDNGFFLITNEKHTS